MKLRVRLAATTVAIIGPLLLLLAYAATTLRAAAIEEGLAGVAAAIAASSVDACEASPDRWGAGSLVEASPFTAGSELFAYDLGFTSTNPAAPPLAPALIEALRRGQASARHVGEPVEVLVRNPASSGACAYVLIRRPIGGPIGGPPAPWLIFPLLCLVAVLALILALLGPLVRGIHSLRRQVRGIAANSYRGRVEISGDDELVELAAAFDASSGEIVRHLDAQQRRERTLREFLANTTHDVMVPLTVLQGHLAALYGHAEATDVATIRAAMQEADYLASLVRNLEIAARLDAGEPQLASDPVDLCDLVRRVCRRHGPLARRRSVELVEAVPARRLEVRGDLTLIEQAISNLVHNAVLHNAAGGHVALLLEAERDIGGFSLVVKDDGPGMSPDALRRLLKRGARGDEARTRHPNAKGLGLAIVQRVVLAHGWTLDLRSGPERGLEVMVCGPLDEPHPSSTLATPPKLAVRRRGANKSRA